MGKSRVALLSLLLASSATAALFACGDDAGTSSTVTPDGGSTTTTPSATDAGSLQAAANGVSVYYGAPVKLDATGTTGPGAVAFEWSVASAPPGSAVTTASLTDASSATPGFQPDAVGVYTLNLKTTSAGQTSTIPVAVTVVDPPVFHIHAVDDGGATKTTTVNVTGVVQRGVGAALSCFTSDAGSSAFAGQTALITGHLAADTWEAPAGQPSRIVYAARTEADGGAHMTLLASTSSSTCATPPTVLDQVDGYFSSIGQILLQPKLNPSGTRIAYVRSLPTGATLATVGFDGTARRDVAALLASPDGGPAPGAVLSMFVARPAWTSDTRIVWLQARDASSWQVSAVDDATGATPTTLMTCASAMPGEVAVLPNGDVLVAQRLAGAKSASLYRYTPDPVTKACSAPREVAPGVGDAGLGLVADFALSPDGTRLAYGAAGDGGAEIRIGGLDGVVQATIPGSMGAGARWVGDSRYLAFPGNGAFFDAGSASTPLVAVAQVDGGDLHVASGPTTSTDFAMPITNGSIAGACAMAPGMGSGVTAFGVLGLLGLRIARRRKRA